MSEHSKPTNLDYLEPADLARVHTAAVERETTNLATGYQPLSVTALLLCSLGLLIGGAFLNKYGGPVAYQPPLGSQDVANIADIRPYDPSLLASNLTPFEKAMKAGAKVYATCAGCHKENGLGAPGFPPLSGSEFVVHGSERMAMAVLNGVMGQITVKGQSFNGVMPAQGSLSDEDVANVMTFVRNSFGNKASMVYPEGVADLRKRMASRPAGPVSEAELLALPTELNLLAPAEEAVATPVGGSAPTAPTPPAPAAP